MTVIWLEPGHEELSAAVECRVILFCFALIWFGGKDVVSLQVKSLKVAFYIQSNTPRDTVSLLHVHRYYSQKETMLLGVAA
jgi:hypothetical protein